MRNQEFSEILQELERSGEAAMERTADGRTYVRRFTRPERLILLGAGHVAQAAAELGAKLNFAVTAADDRPEFADAARFPPGTEVICGPFVPVIQEKLRICGRDYVCILTREHRWDLECLRAVLSGEMPFYLGLMGSRRRTAAQLDRLCGEGFAPELLKRIHTPIGLPIRGATPAEIAVSIAAELVLERRSRPSEGDALERRDTDEAVLRCAAEGSTPRALILVLESEGSAPARAGAMMAADGAGRTFGTVGGGAAEGEALRRARRLLGTGGREVFSVSLKGEDGMECGGGMKLWVEDLPLQPPEGGRRCTR